MHDIKKYTLMKLRNLIGTRTSRDSATGRKKEMDPKRLKKISQRWKKSRR